VSCRGPCQPANSITHQYNSYSDLLQRHAMRQASIAGPHCKFLNPLFSKMACGIFPKIFLWKGHMKVCRCANFGESYIREKISGRNFRKFRWVALTPKLHQISRPCLARLWGASTLILLWLSTRASPVVSEKLGVEKQPLASPSVETGSRSVT